SWQNESLADHDRPLNERGKRDAPRMGRLLRAHGLEPAALICSTARRARKTATKVIEASGYAVDVELRGELYHAPPDACIELLQEQADQHPCVMVVGHNPGMQDLVELLTGLRETFPTAALAQVKLPIDRWRDLSMNTRGTLVQLWRPKELDRLA
ncbi:MAG: histidine phosphatase family protein, partial [Pirellulaceae bacterium]